MAGKMLFVASTRSHILAFHLPYLKAFRADGWTIHTAWGGPDGEVPYADQTLPLPLKKNICSPGNFRATHILRKIIRAEGYDAIIVHTTLAAFFTRLALLGLKQRPHVINMVHGYLVDDQTGRLKRDLMLAAERLTAPVTDLVLTMNQWDHETALRLRLGRQVEFIPGIGVDYSRLDSGTPQASEQLCKTFFIPQNAFVLFFAAEFSANKSQEVLIRALKLLPPHVVLVLAGQGDCQSQCRALAKQLDLGDRVIFPGFVTDIGQWYALADAVVSSSRKEGLPFNIMEAMYCGLPVVASVAKGHSDLIQFF